MFGSPETPAEEPRLTDQQLGQEAHRLYWQAVSILRQSRPFLEQYFDRGFTLGMRPAGVKLPVGSVDYQITIKREFLTDDDLRLSISKRSAGCYEDILLKVRKAVRDGELVDVSDVHYVKIPLEKPEDPTSFGESHEGTQTAVERVEQFLGELQQLLG